MVDVTIDGRAIGDYSDDELVALNQAMGRKTDEIRLQRMIVNRELAVRRAMKSTLDVVGALGSGVQVVRDGDRVSVVVPGVTLEAKASAI